ncbi:hypothetical protein ACFL59_05025 [Planctomycetota bacterium]
MTARTRPLKFRLTSGDLLYFLHIPKTAGTTLFEILRKRFKPEEAVSAEGDVFLDLCCRSSPEDRARYRLMRAHFGYGVYRLLPRRPVFVTMLRDPVARVISVYKHIRRIPHHRLNREVIELGLLEFLEHPRARVRDLQVRHLAGFRLRKEELGALCDDDLLELAKAHLDDLAFFGLTERFDDSIRLLSHTFDWSPIEGYEALNVAPDSPEEVDREALQAIASRNRLDLALYAHARGLFEERVAQLDAELREADHDQ